MAVGCRWGADVEGGVQLARGAAWGPPGCTCWGGAVQLIPSTGGASEHL